MLFDRIETEPQLTGPCLFGVPVPARAFGFSAGWYRLERSDERSRVECPEQIAIDLTGSHDTVSLLRSEAWTAGFGRVVLLKRTADRETPHQAIPMTTEPEVVAA